MAGQVERLRGKFERHASGTAAGLPFDPVKAPEEMLLQVPVDEIHPDPDQPRRDLGDLESLKASILEHGIIQPLVVSVGVPGRFDLIAGERRYTAAKALGLLTVPAVVRTLSQHRRLELQLVENLHRKDLDPFEEASTYRRLIDEFGLNQEELARRIGKSRVSINETLSLARLSQDIAAEWRRTSDRPSKSLLLEIARVAPGPEQRRLWTLARAGVLTVQRARQERVSQRGATTRNKRRSGRSGRHDIHLSDAVVTIKLASASVSPEKLIAALQAALRQYRASLRAR